MFQKHEPSLISELDGVPYSNRLSWGSGPLGPSVSLDSVLCMALSGTDDEMLGTPDLEVSGCSWHLHFLDRGTAVT